MTFCALGLAAMAVAEFVQWLACFHCGPINIGLHIGLLAAVLFSFGLGLYRRDRMEWAAFAFVISFAGAKVATITGSIFFFLPFLAVACIFSLKWRHRWAGKLMAGIYFLRVLWGGAALALGLPDQMFWNINGELFLSAQILICFLGGFHGGNTVRDRESGHSLDPGAGNGVVLARSGDYSRYPPRGG